MLLHKFHAGKYRYIINRGFTLKTLILHVSVILPIILFSLTRLLQRLIWTILEWSWQNYRTTSHSISEYPRRDHSSPRSTDTRQCAPLCTGHSEKLGITKVQFSTRCISYENVFRNPIRCSNHGEIKRLLNTMECKKKKRQYFVTFRVSVACTNTANEIFYTYM